MLEQVPDYVPITFILTTLLTATLFIRAVYLSSFKTKTTLISIGISLWLTVHGILSYNLYYLNTAGNTPPLFPLFTFLPFFILTIVLFNTKKGQAFIDSLPLKALTLISIVRIPVELVLYWLFIYNTIPQLLTFEGHNFDILAGITTPIVLYFGFRKGIIQKKLLLTWNIVFLILLLNIIIHALLSFPTVIQQFAIGQPNTGAFYFPFFWLPSFVAPAVLFTHFVSIRQLLKT